jgi:hypothetical protein
MTMPRERSNAIEKAREFLRSLLDPKLTPRIPKKIRKEAYWCLRHFPHDYEMEQVIKKCPEIFGENKNEK